MPLSRFAGHPVLRRAAYMTELHMGNDRDDFGDDPNGVPAHEGRPSSSPLRLRFGNARRQWLTVGER
jgi:hypothetical protein